MSNQDPHDQPQPDASGGDDSGNRKPKTRVGSGDERPDEDGVPPSWWQAAQEERQRTGESILSILKRMGKFQRHHIKNALELQFGVNYVCLAECDVDQQAFACLPVEVVVNHQAIPIELQGNRMILAMVNPNNLAALDAIKAIAKGKVIKPVVCTPDDWQNYIDRALDKSPA